MLQEREKMLGGILAKMGPQETTPVSADLVFAKNNYFNLFTLQLLIIFVSVKCLTDNL